MSFDIIKTSTLIKEMFPVEYQENGDTLIAFLEAYYVWLEQSDYGRGKQLLEYRDIDTTLDGFVEHFKNKYLANFPQLEHVNIRNIIKNNDSIYESRGTDEGLKLFMRLAYGVEIDIYRPGEDILKASDGEWVVPRYLEVSITSRNNDFIGKEIIGTISGAKAFVDYVVRRVINGNYFDVMYISNIRGDFSTGEQITCDNTYVNNPTVIGSLRGIDIIDGGRDNQVGDIFTITSDFGRQGRARVNSVINGTGRVDFNLVDGGYGFTTTSNTIISNTVFNLSSNVGLEFADLEVVIQPIFDIEFLSANNDFTVGDQVFGYTLDTGILQAQGTVLSVTQESGAGTVKVINSTNTQSNFIFADTIRTTGNTVAALIDSVVDQTASAEVIGRASNSIGVYNKVNTFVSNNFVRGLTSNTIAIVSSLSQGTGADFNIGSLSSTETVLAVTDLIGGVNAANVPYKHIKLNGEGSGLGQLSNVDIIAGGVGYTNATAISFVGGGQSISNVDIIAGGTNYANGERIVFTSNTGEGATAIVTTDAAGVITGVTFANTGRFYSDVPSVAITTSSGSGANLVPLLDSLVHANATITTNGSGSITSITIADSGDQYFSTPTLTVSGGTGANLIPIMNFGFGFPKNESGSSNSIINALLTREIKTIGSIASLTSVSPGQNYNQNPFVRVIEPAIASLNKKDIILSLSNTIGSFAAGEIVTQPNSETLIELTFDNLTGNTGFEVGEYVNQSNNSGLVVYRDASTIRLSDVSGTFVPNTSISSTITNATADVTDVQDYLNQYNTRGYVRSFANNTLVMKRLSFNTNIDTSKQIIGSLTGTTANVESVATDFSSASMGDNSDITSIVRTANGIGLSVEIIDSGFGYRDDDVVQLVNSNNQFIMTGVTTLQRQGFSSGYWKSTRGFLNSDKRIIDSDYYQPFSYEIQTNISFEKYAELVRKIMHMAGAKLFGRTTISSETRTNTNSYSSLLQEDQFSIFVSPSPIVIIEGVENIDDTVATLTTNASSNINIEYNTTTNDIFAAANNELKIVTLPTLYENDFGNITIQANYEDGGITQETTVPYQMRTVGRYLYYNNSDVLPLILGF